MRSKSPSRSIPFFLCTHRLLEGFHIDIITTADCAGDGKSCAALSHHIFNSLIQNRRDLAAATGKYGYGAKISSGSNPSAASISTVSAWSK